MQVAWRKLVDWLYCRLGWYAPERCVFCGVATSLALPVEVSKYGWPCCASCQPEEGWEYVN